MPLTDEFNLIFGVHKGFSAPSSDPNTDEEESTNWEAGFRYNGALGSLEVIGFVNDFENLVGVCTASSGANCEVGQVFRGDAARVQGLETRFSTDWSSSSSFGLPLEATWTWTDAEFRSDLADTNFFGDVEKGDPIPYIPDHQFYISQGVAWQRWTGYLSLNYIDEVCAFASCGPFEQTDSLTTIDASVYYDLTPRIQYSAWPRTSTTKTASPAASRAAPAPTWTARSSAVCGFSCSSRARRGCEPPRFHPRLFCTLHQPAFGSAFLELCTLSCGRRLLSPFPCWRGKARMGA